MSADDELLRHLPFYMSAEDTQSDVSSSLDIQTPPPIKKSLVELVEEVNLLSEESRRKTRKLYEQARSVWNERPNGYYSAQDSITFLEAGSTWMLSERRSLLRRRETVIHCFITAFPSSDRDQEEDDSALESITKEYLKSFRKEFSRLDTLLEAYIRNVRTSPSYYSPEAAEEMDLFEATVLDCETMMKQNISEIEILLERRKDIRSSHA